MVTSIHEQLRERTRPQHSAAEALLEQGEVLQSRDAYCEFLRLQLSLVTSWESVAAPRLAEPYRTRWSQERRASLIRSDLSFLGSEALPCPATAAWEGGAPQAWGVAYVLEGSALGGRVLAGRVAAPLGLGGAGLEFLRSGGAPHRWRAFLTDLELGAAHHGVDGVLEGAVAGFAFVLNHLPRVVAMHRREVG